MSNSKRTDRPDQHLEEEPNLGNEISQLSSEIRSLYHFMSTKNSPGIKKIICEPKGIDILVEELFSEIASMYSMYLFVLFLKFKINNCICIPYYLDSDTDSDARDCFETFFEENINSLNTLDVLKRLVRELCVAVFRSDGAVREAASGRRSRQSTSGSFTSPR